MKRFLMTTYVLLLLLIIPTLTFAQNYHQYDTDQNWEIEDFELLDAIDEWAAGNLGDFPLLDLIDYWAAGSYCWDSATESYKPGACGGELPPDPKDVATDIDPTVATTMIAATEFLYTGSDPIQTGVAAGTIEPLRVAVLRGMVKERDGSPISGVSITILNHSEFGQTLSRADGMFDIAVNGGGYLTVNYSKTGYLTSQRQVNVPWQDYAWLPDVVLIPADPLVTNIDLTSAEPFQVAAGSVTTDSRGTRKATLLFPQGTGAQMVMPEGAHKLSAILMYELPSTRWVTAAPRPCRLRFRRALATPMRWSSASMKRKQQELLKSDSASR